jgi:hypothetical protein
VLINPKKLVILYIILTLDNFGVVFFEFMDLSKEFVKFGKGHVSVILSIENI